MEVGGRDLINKQRRMGSRLQVVAEDPSSLEEDWEDIHSTELRVKVSGKAGHFAS